MADFTLIYNGKDITKDLEANLVNLTFDESLNGSASSVDFTVMDDAGKWMDLWHPSVEDGLQLYFNAYNGVMNCRSFFVDELVYSGDRNNLLATVKGLSIKPSTMFSSDLHRAYKDYSLKNLINDIAGMYGLKVGNDAIANGYTFNGVCNGNALSFLAKELNKYGAMIKIEDSTLYIVALDYIRAGSFFEVKKEDVIRYSIQNKATGRYKSCTCKWYDVKGGAFYSGSYSIGGAGSTAEIWQQVNNNEDAVNQAKAWLEEKQKKEVEIELTLMGDARLRAGALLRLVGFGKYDRKYIIGEVRHQINRGSGYLATLKLRK
jgi:phage protein D